MGWSAILYSPYNSTVESIFALNGTYRKRIDGTDIYEWGMDAPDTRPLVAVGTSTGLTGDYNAKYTWARKERNTVVYESNPSNAGAAAVTLADESFLITATTPPDEQINCIRFYRTSAGGSTYSLDTDLNYVNHTSYACCFDWEDDDDYISGTPYRFTTPNTTDNTEDCYSWEVYREQYTGYDYKTELTTDEFIKSLKDDLKKIIDHI